MTVGPWSAKEQKDHINMLELKAADLVFLAFTRGDARQDFIRNKQIYLGLHGKNICRLFHILALFPLAKNEKELDYYHQNVNI